MIKTEIMSQDPKGWDIKENIFWWGKSPFDGSKEGSMESNKKVHARQYWTLHMAKLS